MKGTLIDTTSLITLAMDKPIQGEHLSYSDGIFNFEKNQLSGMEAILLSNNIIVDYPSYQRNLVRFPKLNVLEKNVEFINVNTTDEDNCYISCADTIVPLINRPGDFLVDIFCRHLEFLDYCEISQNEYGYFPSTYWKDLSGQLSKGENSLVKALESKFGKYTPFSGAALTNLIRFFYYTSCQDIFDCNLSLHHVKSCFLTDFYRNINSKEGYIAKNIIDIFDKSYSDNYNKNIEKWIGIKNTEFSIPLLTNFVNKHRNKDNTIIEDLFEMRESNLLLDYRDAIKELEMAISNKDSSIVNDIISKIEIYTNNLIKGERNNPSKYTHKIGISIPFIGGLGTEINLNFIPKIIKKPSDKILIFLHKMIK
jgi:hypothetical protein